MAVRFGDTLPGNDLSDMNGLAGYRAASDLRIVLAGALHVPGAIP
jgi:hypothetical protein